MDARTPSLLAIGAALAVYACGSLDDAPSKGTDTSPTFAGDGGPESCDPSAPDLAGCTCMPGASRACSTGNGACGGGVQTCKGGDGELGGVYGPCTGAVCKGVDGSARHPSGHTMAAGGGHTCMITSSGSVTCWGLNDHGQLGNGTVGVPGFTAPAAVVGLGAPAVDISAGEYHTCAVLQGGGVVCWGGCGRACGTSGVSATPVAIQGLASGVEQVAAGEYHTCALATDGTVSCWWTSSTDEAGEREPGVDFETLAPAHVAGLTDAVAVGAGDGFACALRATGAVSCWGGNTHGELGVASPADSPTPLAVPGIDGAVALATLGGSHACAILGAGGAKCWGWNGAGQLGDGTNVDATGPVSVSGLSGEITALATSGEENTCALVAGAMQCWGLNTSGELALPHTVSSSSSPGVVPGLPADVVDFATGDFHSCVRASNGTVVCWGFAEAVGCSDPSGCAPTPIAGL